MSLILALLVFSNGLSEGHVSLDINCPHWAATFKPKSTTEANRVKNWPADGLSGYDVRYTTHDLWDRLERIDNFMQWYCEKR